VTSAADEARRAEQATRPTRRQVLDFVRRDRWHGADHHPIGRNHPVVRAEYAKQMASWYHRTGA
jgi:hypothetical protein